MNLRTELKIKPSREQISYKDPVLLMGSCFSENIGKKLEINKFKTLVNPFGTLYNPHSLFKAIKKTMLKDTKLDEKNIILNQGVYRYLDFHSALAHASKEELLKSAAGRIESTANFLVEARWLIITFGSAIVYKYRKTNEIAGNCHKLPPDNFERQFMKTEEIIMEFDEVYSKLSGFNQNINIILTLSPVRHTREGFEDNQVSKSILRLACSEIIAQYKNVSYFPSYEIMMDDLRDYRFYNEDLVHPNSLAIDYIWEKFCEKYMDEESLSFLKEWNKILNALSHRPFHPETEEYKQFVKQTVEKLLALKDKVNVDDEIKNLESRYDPS